MAAFHEVQFPPAISYGASGGPGYLTTVVATASGHEHRNSNWAAARGKWDVASGLRDREHVAELIAFFRARRGRAHGFRFKDWTDYQGVAQVLGTGTGALTTFQLIKNYASGGIIEGRLITRPVTGTVKVYRNGVLATSGVTVDHGTGVVTFTTAPAAGVIVTADFEFDVPTRFDTDQMDITIETYALGSWGQVPVVEIRV
jgi:uncharacterized protein (TIGR02217 family)